MIAQDIPEGTPPLPAGYDTRVYVPLAQYIADGVAPGTPWD